VRAFLDSEEENQPKPASSEEKTDTTPETTNLERVVFVVWSDSDKEVYELVLMELLMILCADEIWFPTIDA
jgi:hypothetical protein